MWLIADGFDMAERLTDLEEQVSAMLPFAYGHELKVKAVILTHPGHQVLSELRNGELEPKA